MLTAKSLPLHAKCRSEKNRSVGLYVKQSHLPRDFLLGKSCSWTGNL